jgi:hypothetical protein
VVLRPLGTPLPLGFIGLSGATTVLSAQQLGLIDAGESHFVGLVILAFAVPLQLVASVFGFLSRDTVAGTGMGILVGSWLSIGLVTLVSPPGGTSEALGVLLLLAGGAMLISASAAPCDLLFAVCRPHHKPDYDASATGRRVPPVPCVRTSREDEILMTDGYPHEALDAGAFHGGLRVLLGAAVAVAGAATGRAPVGR